MHHGIPQKIAGSATGPGALRKSKSQPWSAWRDVLLVERSKGASVNGRRRLPVGAAASELRLVNLHVDASGVDVELDRSPVLSRAKRPADSGLGRDVKDAGAVMGAAHAPVADADHVAHALLQKLFRDRQVAPFRHARRADRARIAQHDHLSSVTSRSGSSIVRFISPGLSKTMAGPTCFRNFGSRRGGFHHRTVRRQIAAQHRQRLSARQRHDRIVLAADDVVVPAVGIGDIFAERACR